MYSIRRATEQDASGIAAVLEQIAAERIHSAIDQPFTVEQESEYIRSLSPREIFHVAIDESGHIVGFQSLDLWARSLNSMRHVGQIGTFLLAEWRRRGLGCELFRSTEAFARRAEYTKLLIQVRASNLAAQRFYGRLGFEECGRLRRQVRIDDVDDDEILMEKFL